MDICTVQKHLVTLHALEGSAHALALGYSTAEGPDGQNFPPTRQERSHAWWAARSPQPAEKVGSKVCSAGSSAGSSLRTDLRCSQSNLLL